MAAALPIPEGAELEPFGLGKIVKNLKVSEEEWNIYHRTMVNFRNARVAHVDFTARHNERPDLTLALESACLYREWLLELLRAFKTAGHDIDISEITTEQTKDLFRREIAAVCR